jgi:glutathione S-transferase
MITVHHLEYSQSFRILWLLEELGATYDLKIYPRDPKTMMAPAEYKAISPLGTSPVISDGAFLMAETNAIVEYILDQHGDQHLRPGPGAANRNAYLFWFHAAQGSLMPALTMATVFDALKTRAPGVFKPFVRPVIGRGEASMVTPRMAALVRAMEDDLSKGPWFAGEQFTAADIVMSYCMEAAAAKGFITDAHPNSLAWIARMHARPAFQTALKKDGTGQVAFTAPA